MTAIQHVCQQMLNAMVKWCIHTRDTFPQFRITERKSCVIVTSKFHSVPIPNPHIKLIRSCLGKPCTRGIQSRLHTMTFSHQSTQLCLTVSGKHNGICVADSSPSSRLFWTGDRISAALSELTQCENLSTTHFTANQDACTMVRLQTTQVDQGMMQQ